MSYTISYNNYTAPTYVCVSHVSFGACKNLLKFGQISIQEISFPPSPEALGVWLSPNGVRMVPSAPCFLASSVGA